MSQNYKKRVENFVINMLEAPVVTTDYSERKRENQQFRTEKPEKFIGNAQFYVKGQKSEKDRIRTNIEQNSSLEFCPVSCCAHHCFRDRLIDKEIQSEMRFCSKTALERIQQYLTDNMQQEVENLNFRQIKQRKKHNNLPDGVSSSQKKAYMNRIAKDLLSSLHNKTHFQAATALYNNLPISVCDSIIQKTSGSPNKSVLNPEENEGKKLNKEKVLRNSQSLPKLQRTQQTPYKPKQEDSQDKMVHRLSVDSFSDQIKNLNNSKNEQIEAFNPIETSRKILLHCNIIKRKNPKVNKIQIGQGHNISTGEKSVGQIYRELYHKPLNKTVNPFQNLNMSAINSKN